MSIPAALSTLKKLKPQTEALFDGLDSPALVMTKPVGAAVGLGL